MNKRSRLNYINALSQDVEHKKMYKAKKQWVVAGISFLVATGMGVIGSHLTTHAAGINNGTNQQTASLAPKLASGSASNIKQPASSNSVKKQANGLHNQIVNNNTHEPHFNSAYENYLKANPQLTSLYNSKANSNVTSTSFKSSASSYSVNSKKQNKPLMKLELQGSNPYQDSDTSQVLKQGRWGTAYYEFHKDGTFWVHDGQLDNALYFQNKSNSLNQGINGIMHNGNAHSDDNRVLHIKTNNIQLSNGNNGWSDVGLFSNLQSCTDMDLSGINYIPQDAVLDWLIGSDPKLARLDISTLDTRNHWISNLLTNDNNLSEIVLGKNTILNSDALLSNKVISDNFINISSTLPQSVPMNTLDNGLSHSGIWTRNAELINLQYNGQTVASDLIRKPANTSENASDAPLDIPSEYHINPNQQITINGGITPVSVELASTYNTSVANSIASSADVIASNSASSNDNNFASALNGALTNGSYTYNTLLTASENSAVSTAAKDYQNWSSGSSRANINATTFASDLEKVLSGSSYQNNSSLTTQENSVISNAASNYARWNPAASSADTVYNWLTSNGNSNSSALSSMITNASSVSASASSAFSVLGLSSGSSYTGSTVLSQLSSINSNLGSASSNDIGYMVSQINSDLYSSGNKTNASTIANSVSALSSALGSLDSAASAISWVETSGSSLMNSLNTGSASATIQNAINSAASSLLATSSGNNSMTGTISSLANSVANSYAKNLVSSSKSGSNTLYSGIVANVASSYARSLANSLTSVYESQASESNDIKSLTSGFSGSSNSIGIIPSMASSYAQSVANSLTVSSISSGSSATNISTIANSIANNMVSSLFSHDNISSSSTIASVANSVANTLNYETKADESHDVSSLSNRVAFDENNIMTGLKATLSDLDKAQTSLNDITTTVNGNAQAINTLQNSYSALNTQLNGSNGNGGLKYEIAADKANILNNSINLSTLTNDEATLSGYAQNASNLASSANSLAKQNSAAVANLKSNTAITVTFMSGNSQVSSPVTLTQGYIESVGSQVSGKSNTYDITSLLNLDVHGYTAANDYQVTLSPNASGVASIAMSSNAGNGGMRNYALNLGASANSSLGLTDNTSAKNIVNLSGMSIKYTGKVTLNYNVGNHTIKSIQVPYSDFTNVGDKNVNVLANINPNKHLNKVISDFDTHNFEYSSESGNNVNEVSPNLIPQSDNTDYESTNPYNVQNALSPVITFTAQSVTENIDYINDSGSVVGSNNSALSGTVDTQGSVTSANANSMPANYQLANSDTGFTFTSNGASVNVPVVSTSTNTTNSPENNHSNTTNTKPANMKNVIDVTINDVDGNGNTVRTYHKNINITANQGTSFDLKPQDYLTNGYSLNQNGKSNTNQDIQGEVTANGLTTTTGTWTFYASKNASDINGSKANKFTPSTNNVPSDNQKPETPVPSTVSDTPSGKNNNNSGNSKAPNNSKNSTNEKNAKNAYATIYIIRRVNGANKSISSKTISENGEPIGYKYTIKPSDKSIQPSGYTVANDDKDSALTGFIQTDGSLSNGTATFYYDVDSSQIRPMEVVYKNDVTHDYINASTGSDLGTSDTGNKAIQPINSAQLATLGTVGDTVSVKSLLTVPHGYEFSDNNANDYDVTLQKAKQGLGAYVLTLSVSESNNPDSAMSSQSSTVTSNMSTANSWANNSSFSDATRSSISNDIKSMSSDDSEAAQFSGKGTAGSNSAQQYFNSASSAYSNASSLATSASASVQSSVSASNSSASASVASLASLVANDVKSNQPDNTGSVSLTSSDIQDLAKDINIQPETNTVVDSSALTSLTNEVATNNSEINSLANKPAPTATVNYNNFDNLINNGIDKLEDTINKDFKANVHEVHAKSVTPKKTIGKRTYSYLKWLRVVKPLKLYNNNHEAVKTIKPRHRITLNVKAAYKVNNHIIFKVSYKHHNYFIKANNKAIKNAYLPASHKLVGRRVRVLYNVYANRRKASGRVKTLHKGYKSTIKNIVRIGNHNVTRIQLADGLWISANMNYVEVL